MNRIPWVVPTIAWLVALALLALTVFVASQPLGEWNMPFAIAIATLQALLILAFFMHLRRASALQRLAAATGYFWFGIMVTLVLADYLMRG